MPQAVGTSLLTIARNAATALAVRLGTTGLAAVAGDSNALAVAVDVMVSRRRQGAALDVVTDESHQGLPAGRSVLG